MSVKKKNLINLETFWTNPLVGLMVSSESGGRETEHRLHFSPISIGMKYDHMGCGSTVSLPNMT